MVSCQQNNTVTNQTFDRRSFIGCAVQTGLLTAVGLGSAIFKHHRDQERTLEKVISAALELRNEQDEMLKKLPDGLSKALRLALLDGFLSNVDEDFTPANRVASMQNVRAELEKQGLILWLAHRATAEEQGTIEVDVLKLEKYDVSLEHPLLDRLKIKADSLPDVFFVDSLMTAPKKPQRILMGSIYLHGTGEEKILLFRNNLQTYSGGDPERERAHIQQTISNEVGNLVFIRLLENKAIGPLPNSDYSKDQLGEAFSDLFSFQTKSQKGLLDEILRIYSNSNFNYALSKELLLNGVDSYAESVGRSRNEVLIEITTPDAISRAEADQLQKFILEAYQAQPSIAFLLET